MTKKDFHIGQHIRKLRRYQNRTLQEVANVCNFSRSLLSKIETGKILPPVATLSKIANALGTTVSAILEDGNSVNASVIRWDESKENFVQTERGYSISPIAIEIKDKKMQPFFFQTKQGEVKKHKVSHEGEEYILVLEGTIRFRVGHVEYTLSKGDSIYFDSHEEHGVMPVSEQAIYLDIFV